MNGRQVLLGLWIAGLLCVAAPVCAEDATTDWKQQMASDRQTIREQHTEMKQNAKQAKGEEKEIKAQIQQALAGGDKEKAEQLKEQLLKTHSENVAQKKEDKAELKSARKEMKSDIKQARESGVIPPKKRLDRDNNPPGPKGGPGTNWENPPGPKGGPGASPNRKGRRK